MSYAFRCLAVAGCLLGLGACAALQAPGLNDRDRTYAQDLRLVIDAAVVAYQEAGMEIENQFWKDGATYVITGFRRSSIVRSRGEGVQVAAMTVTVTRLGETQTRVEAETTQDDGPAAASSADRRNDDARRFFARLDARFD